MKRWQYSAACAFAALGCAMPAQAYVGPGAGVTLIGALIGLLSAIGLALWAVLRWPVRRYLARRKAAASPRQTTQAPARRDPDRLIWALRILHSSGPQ